MVLEGFSEDARRARIEQNRQKLLALGLTREDCTAQIELQPKAYSKLKRSLNSQEAGSIPQRSSKRLQGISAPELARERCTASLPVRLVPNTKREVCSLAVSGPAHKDFTSHNLMRLKSMSMSAQEKRITKISNLSKLNNLIQLYQEKEQEELYQLAVQRKQQLLEGF